MLGPVELADLDKLDSDPLSDFSFDIWQLEMAADDWGDDELAAYADRVYQRMVKT